MASPALKVFCPEMAHITPTHIPLAKASLWSHPSLDNKEMISAIYPKRSGVRIPTNSPTNNHNPIAGLFLWRAICLSLPARLRMPACSYLRHCSLRQVHLEETADGYDRTSLSYVSCYQQGLYSIFSGFSGIEHRSVTTLVFRKIAVEHKLSVWEFPLLVHIALQRAGMLVGGRKSKFDYVLNIYP